MQPNGPPHVSVCVSTDHFVCVCVRSMNESFDHEKDCMCIHGHGNPWYQYRVHLSVDQCIHLTILASALSDAHTHIHTFPLSILPTIGGRTRMRVLVWASF